MDVRILIISMTIILIALFFITDRYRKKEVELMRAEGKYYEAIKKWRHNPHDKNIKEEVKLMGKEYGLKVGMLDLEIESMLEKDLKSSLSQND